MKLNFDQLKQLLCEAYLSGFDNGRIMLRDAVNAAMNRSKEDPCTVQRFAQERDATVHRLMASIMRLNSNDGIVEITTSRFQNVLKTVAEAKTNA